MTISSETRRAGPFTGNGATTVFPFAFKVFEKADLRVVRLDALAVEHILVLDSDYSVALNADQDADPGGTITYPISGSPLPSTETLTVVGALEYLQPTDITNQGGFFPDVVEKSLDRAVILVQQLYELSLRSVRVPVSDSGGSNELPTTDARKGTVLAFDEVTGAPLPGPSIGAVGTVVGNVAAINSVADNIADIDIVVANIDALIGASSFAAVYQGPHAVAPTARNDASPLQPGDLYFNTAVMLMYVYRGAAWLEVSADIAGSIHAAASKATPVDADELPIADSAASFGLKKLTWANLKATLKAYFDTLYLKLSGGTLTGALMLAADPIGALEAATKQYVDNSGMPQIQPVTASVASNALTLTLNATKLDFRSSTLADGTVNRRAVAAPISLVVPSGATLGTVNGQASRLVLLAIDNAGTVELAVANLAGGVNLDETTIISTTAISAAANSASTIYSTIARTNVPFRVVAFIDITEATAGTWASAPTTIQGAGGQALAAISSIGYGQTWQNVLASRAVGTTYYNTTGKPIMVSIGEGGDGARTLTVNGVTVSTAGGTSADSTLCAVVPPGASYAFPSGTLVSWAELR